MFSAGSAPEAPPGESRPAGTWAGGRVAGRAPSAPRPLEAETQPHPHPTLGSLIPLLRPAWAPLPRSLPRPPGAAGGQRVAGARPLPESRSAEEAEAAAAPRPRRAHGVVRVSAALGPCKRGLRRGRGRGEASPSPSSPGPAALSGRPWADAEGRAVVGGRAGEGSAPLVVVAACPLAAPRGRGPDARVSAARAGRPRAPGASWVPGGAAGLRGWPCSDITPSVSVLKCSFLYQVMGHIEFVISF